MREIIVVIDHLSIFRFTAAIGAHSISDEVVGFFIYGFLKDKSLCLLSVVINCYACYSLR